MRTNPKAPLSGMAVTGLSVAFCLVVHLHHLNAQVSLLESWGHQPFIRANVRPHHAGYAAMVARLKGLQGAVRSVAQQSYEIPDKSDPEFQPGKPVPQDFYYFRFNQHHEIQEHWVYTNDTVPETKNFYRDFKQDKRDSVITPRYERREVFLYDGDETLKAIVLQGWEKPVADKTCFGKDSCCYFQNGMTYCYAGGKLTRTRENDQSRIFQYHPNGELKTYLRFWISPDTLPIDIYAYDVEGYLLKKASVAWDRHTRTQTIYIADTLLYDDRHDIATMERTLLSQGTARYFTYSCVYENDRLVEVTSQANGIKTLVEAYRYDKSGQLAQEAEYNLNRYEYDDHHNWIKKVTFTGQDAVSVQYRQITYW